MESDSKRMVIVDLETLHLLERVGEQVQMLCSKLLSPEDLKPKIPKNKKVIGMEELASMVSYSRSTLYRMVNRPDFYPRISQRGKGQKILIDMEKLTRYLEEQNL